MIEPDHHLLPWARLPRPGTGPAGALPGPSTGSPARRPGSIRRTSSLDLTRPRGPNGPLLIQGRARDLATNQAGEGSVVDNALMSATVADGVVTSMSFHPDGERSAHLTGRKAGAGFRTAVWRHLRDHHNDGSALHLLLDEMPVAMIIAGFTYRRSLPAQIKHTGRRPDVCAGWVTDGRAMQIQLHQGAPPAPDTPLAPSLVSPDDALGWHTLRALPMWGLSRRRRLDVSADGDGLQVEAMFRDSFVDGDGAEKVLHEYHVAAAIEPVDGRVTEAEARPWVLPHWECPISAASTARIVGARAARLRDVVSLELFGPATCTHLNDLLRSLADAPALGRLLPGWGQRLPVQSSVVG